MRTTNESPVWFCLIFAMGFLCLGTVATAKFSSDSPATVIRRYADQTVETLANPELLNQKDHEVIREKLFNQLAPLIDFQLMTRSALGPQARQTSQAQLDELTRVFRPLVVRQYTDRLFQYMVEPENPWKLDRIRILEQELRGNGRYALVKTQADVYQGEKREELSLNFKMYRRENRWLVYDLVFENVSLVENYRSQFSAVLANHSVDHLIHQLREKLQEARPGEVESITSR